MKEFIKQNCLTKSGRSGFKSQASNIKWWDKQFLLELEEINRSTNFLSNASIPQRCWHVYNSIYITNNHLKY